MVLNKVLWIYFMNDLNELYEMLYDNVDFLGNLTTIYLLIAIPKKKKSDK